MGSTIVVDSVVYNMAGEEIHRPDYLKSLVVRNVLSGTKSSIADDLRSGYLNGPAMKLRSFFRWASNPDNYGEIGLPTGALEVHGQLNGELVAEAIPHDPGVTLWVQNARVSYAIPALFAEQWIILNRPDDIETNWIANYDKLTNEITIVFEDTSTEVFTPVDYDHDSKYVYAWYTTVIEEEEGAIVEGEEIHLAEEEEFPDTTDWELIEEEDDPIVHRIYEKKTTTSVDGDLYILTETMHQWEDGTDFYYRIDTQETLYRGYGDTLLFIYKIGSGNAYLDSMVESAANYGEFFPFIPLRIDNEFLSETYLPDAYAQVKKAYKKATSAKLTKLIEQLEDNESLEDIDHTYVTFGVSLNVLEDACKKYLYTFFESLQASQLGGGDAYQNWLDAVALYNAQKAAWDAWFASGLSEGEPPRPSFPAPATNSIRISGTGAINSYFDVRIEWNFINNSSGVGLGKVGAKVGEIWFEHIGTFTVETIVTYFQHGERERIETRTVNRMRLYWQKTATSYVYLDLVGLNYKNFIYGGQAVEIDAKDAVEDPEESGFIVPLHYDTWRQMSLIDTSQMATACVFTVFNCYEVFKEKWYQTGIFKVILVVAIAIVSVVFTGGAGLGLLGTNFAVGSALGFTGLTAAIVGSVANALAALVLTTILERTLGSLGFIGQILGAILMFVVGSVGAAFRSGAGLSINWGDLLKVDNLLKLTDAIGRGVSQMLNDDTLAIQQESLDFAKKAAREADKIQQAFFEEFGYGGGVIDPLMFTDSTEEFVAESSSTFLTRTLLTGSEIAEMSQALLYGFAEFSLELPDAFT